MHENFKGANVTVLAINLDIYNTSFPTPIVHFKLQLVDK